GRTGRKHRGVFATAVHGNRLGVQSPAQVVVGLLTVQGEAGRGAQQAGAESGTREDLAYPVEVEGLSGVAGGGKRKQFTVQVKAAVQERRHLERLVGGAGEELGVRLPESELDRAVGGQYHQ